METAVKRHRVVPAKAVPRRKCDHCARETDMVIITRRTFYPRRGETETLIFCSEICEREYLYDDVLAADVQQRVDDELAGVKSTLCSACRRKVE